MKRFLNRKRVVVGIIVLAVVVAIAALGAVSRSTSNTAVCSPIASSASVPPTGATVPNALWWFTLAVSPSNPNTLVLTTSAGLYRSTDGGKTWVSVGPKNVEFTSIVGSGSKLIAGGVKTTPTTSPVVRVGLYRTVSNGPAVLAVSTDGGKTWRTVHPAGLPNIAVQAMATDPSDSAMVYLLTNDGRLYRSSNGGSSFSLADAKLGIPPWAIALTRGTQFIGGDMDSGTYASANGKKWATTPFTDLNCNKMVMEYAVQPGNSTTVLMTSIGIVISTDGGKSWHTALKSPTMFGPVAYAPGQAKTAYAVGFDGSVWKSTDGGQTWKPVPKS